MCVLLVEDELLIREMMSDCLQDAGYDVVAVENGALAFDVISRAPAPFSLLVSDFHMPGNIDGSQVAARIRECWPAIPVIIASGRPDIFEVSWKHELGYQLLKKPYLPSQLVSLVGALTAARVHQAVAD